MNRPINVKPWHRRRIKTTFTLFNAKNPNGLILKTSYAWKTGSLPINDHYRKRNDINHYSTSNISGSNSYEREDDDDNHDFESSLILNNINFDSDIKVLIPGWLDNIRRTLWVKKTRDAYLLLAKDDINIIVIDWINFTPYTMATANTRVVGAELASLIAYIEFVCKKRSNQFKNRYKIMSSSDDSLVYLLRQKFHLIGHSLGAHIAGYCGSRLPGLGRITALDPARPFFQNMPKSVRLDRDDALFVDAIHSDFTPENAIFLIMSFGMTTPVGHLDFYPNGPPLLQPGCARDALTSPFDGLRKGLEHQSVSVALLEGSRYLVACDHQRSHEWFVESLLVELSSDIGHNTPSTCQFVGVKCPDFAGLLDGRCGCDDSIDSCAIMGSSAIKPLFSSYKSNFVKRKDQSLYQRNDESQIIIDEDNKIEFIDDEETIYERENKWFLKTSSKELHYCLHQYQVLIYLSGKSDTNNDEYSDTKTDSFFILTIIGSKGRLMNQKFVPQFKQLIPNSMQPFFVVLDAKCSLGSILSVSISWHSKPRTRKNRIEIDNHQLSYNHEADELDKIQSIQLSYFAHPLLPMKELPAPIDADNSYQLINIDQRLDSSGFGLRLKNVEKHVNEENTKLLKSSSSKSHHTFKQRYGKSETTNYNDNDKLKYRGENYIYISQVKVNPIISPRIDEQEALYFAYNDKSNQKSGRKYQLEEDKRKKEKISAKVWRNSGKSFCPPRPHHHHKHQSKILLNASSRLETRGRRSRPRLWRGSKLERDKTLRLELSLTGTC